MVGSIQCFIKSVDQQTLPRQTSSLIRAYSVSYTIDGISLAWPDPIFAQGVYRLQYKRPRKKGLEQFTAATGTATIAVVMGVN